MDIDDADQILASLRKSMETNGGTQVRHYRFDRTTADGSLQEVDVEIHDAGATSPTNRFQVMAYGSDGARCSGNPEQDLETAIAVTHWFALDTPKTGVRGEQK